MERFVFVGIVGFLKHCHIVHPTFMEIAVLIGVDGIYFYPHHSEILSRQLTGFADILHIALSAAFPGEDQYFLHAGIGNDLHFVLDLLHAQLHAPDMVVAVEAAVYAVVLAIIGNVQRGEQIYGVAEVLACLPAGLLCHFFQKRLCRGR